MQNSCNLTAIVVGNRRHTAIQNAINFLESQNFGYEFCADIYSALAFMNKASVNSNLLIISDFMPLTMDTVNFFALASKNINLKICCIAEAISEPSHSLLKTVVRKIVFIKSTAQLRPVIEQYKCSSDTDTITFADANSFANRISTLADKFFLTKAEQNALLGEQSDESLAARE